MKNFNIKFNLNDLTYKDKNNPGKSEEEIAESGVFEEGLADDAMGKVNMSIFIPMPYVDINNIVNQVQAIYGQALEKTGFQLGKILISFDKKQVPIDKVQPYVWADKVIHRMEELDKFVRNNNGQLRFSEFAEFREECSEWSLNQVKIANYGVDFLANVIKENKLSPYEAAVFLACWSAENLLYEDTLLGTKRDFEVTDSIVPIFNRGLALCVGFSEFAKAVFDSVDFENLDLTEYPDAGILRTSKIGVSLNIVGTQGKPNHCQNAIQIFDPKYGIDGKYIYDLTGAVDRVLFRKDPQTDSKRFGAKVDNDRFLFSKKDIFDTQPAFRYFYTIDEFDGYEELKCEDDKVLEYYRTLKERTETFTDELGETTTRETFEKAKSKCEALAKKYPLSVIMESCAQKIDSEIE